MSEERKILKSMFQEHWHRYNRERGLKLKENLGIHKMAQIMLSFYNTCLYYANNRFVLNSVLVFSVLTVH